MSSDTPDPPASEPAPEPAPEPAKGPDRDRGGHLSAGRRWTVRVLLFLATVLGVLAMLSVWVDRQALNAENWSQTSSSLLQNQQVRDQVSNYLVDQVYATVDVSKEIEGVLPKDLKPLAEPATGALRNLATKSVDLILSRPIVQDAWKGANKLTMQQFVNIVEEKQNALVTSSGGAVIINLRPLVESAVEQLGLPSNLTSQIPPDVGHIKVLSSEQVRDVKSYARLLRGMALVLPIVVFLLFALAIAVAKGARRRTLIYVGADLVVIGAVVLALRVIGGHVVVDQLATTASVKPATQAVWDIGTNMLRDIAWAAILTAIPIIAAAVLAGPTHPAVATRRVLTPWMRDQRGVVYGVVGAVILLLVVWAPLAWMQSPLPVLLMIVLVAVGVELLRRQSIREFPDAELPDFGEKVAEWTGSARRAVHRGGVAVSGAVTTVRERAAGPDAAGRAAATGAAAGASAAAAEAPTAVVAPVADVPGRAAAPPAPAPAAPAEDDVLARLERLAKLQESGLLTPDEVAEQKRRILEG